MLVLFKGHYIDPFKVVKVSAGPGASVYTSGKKTCKPTIWVALGGKDYVHFSAKVTYTYAQAAKDTEINWNEICADELAEIAQEINSLLKAAKCKN